MMSAADRDAEIARLRAVVKELGELLLECVEYLPTAYRPELGTPDELVSRIHAVLKRDA